jgi:hypothetical protein
MPQAEKFFLPLTVVAAVAGVWALFRSGDKNIGALTPNPSSGGVPASYSASGTVQPVSYNVPAVALQPSAITLLSNPWDSGSVPSYLTFNQPPQADINKLVNLPHTEAKAGCGCNSCDPCAGATNLFDATGGTKLSSSRSRQIDAEPTAWIDRARSNVNAWLAMESGALA